MKTIVHLSDIHFRYNWDENHGVVLSALFEDLKELLNHQAEGERYLLISGDVVQRGNSSEMYKEFHAQLISKLSQLGFDRERCILIPGNHDVDRSVVETNQFVRKAILNSFRNESEVNDYIEKNGEELAKYFKSYIDFEGEFFNFGVRQKSGDVNSIYGAGHILSSGVGCYCLNSAILSMAGVGSSGAGDENDPDYRRLVVETRNLNKWISSCGAEFKILVMHHPIEWYTEWMQKELKIIIGSSFDLVVSGHVHDHNTLHFNSGSGGLLSISAPALFTHKADELGYSIIEISNSSISRIRYRQWARKFRSFVAGVNFSNTPSGILEFSQLPPSLEGMTEAALIERLLQAEFEKSLWVYSKATPRWIDPILSNQSEDSRSQGGVQFYSINDLLSPTENFIVSARAQFGLTCLARKICLNAWKENRGLYIYLDSRDLKASVQRIRACLDSEVKKFGKSSIDVTGVIVDSWCSEDRYASTLLVKIFESFPDLQIIVMQTLGPNHIASDLGSLVGAKPCQSRFLWSLSRKDIRQVVEAYNDKYHIGDVDQILGRIVLDLDVLNIHRTPLNCLLLLRVFEYGFDDSPVNRTELLGKILYLLFNSDSVSSYTSTPDVKDCEYVLGYLADILIRDSKTTFLRGRMAILLREFCNNNALDLEVERLLDVLLESGVLVDYGECLGFRFRYWMYYFAAQRMHQSEEFYNFVFTDVNYANYPEVIEFFTGIDRRRSSAIEKIASDLRECRKRVSSKVGLPEDLNPFQFIEWHPSAVAVERMRKEIVDGVTESNLPTEVKDCYQDRSYDRCRPYAQNIEGILESHNLVYLMRSLSAASRGLRNSDYVDIGSKESLLFEIMSGFRQLVQALLVIVPLLARDGRASYDGASFVLDESFATKSDEDERLRCIINEIPYNICNWYRDDLRSKKMGPLLLKYFRAATSEIEAHVLLLIVLRAQPRGWREAAEGYIRKVGKNSFYMYDVNRVIRHMYRYSFVSSRELRDMEYLIKMIAAKHSFGQKEPGPKTIKKIGNEVLPLREVDEPGRIERTDA